MTVEKLINKLKNYPKDMDIFIYSIEGMLTDDIIFDTSVELDGDVYKDILIIMDDDSYLQ